MADTYEIVTQYETVEYLGSTKTRPVIAVGVVTQEHGVYFETRIAKADYSAANARSNARGFTIIYELLFTIPGVTGVEWSQRPTPAGRLEDTVTVFLESTSGNSSDSVTVPYSRFTQDHIAQLVGDRRAELDQAEAS